MEGIYARQDFYRMKSAKATAMAEIQAQQSRYDELLSQQKAAAEKAESTCKTNVAVCQ